MNLTLTEIATHRTRLRQEIMERECLLAAFEVVEKYAANGHHPDSLQLSGMVSSLLPSRLLDQVKEVPTPATPAPAPVALPEKAREKPYVHPELEALFDCLGSNGKIVSWAIQRMTEDYTIRDIATLLEREGSWMSSAQLSVVLTRMKNRGEIEQITRGRGRRPAIFRGPGRAAVEETGPAPLTINARHG